MRPSRPHECPLLIFFEDQVTVGRRLLMRHMHNIFMSHAREHNSIRFIEAWYLFNHFFFCYSLSYFFFFVMETSWTWEADRNWENVCYIVPFIYAQICNSRCIPRWLINFGMIDAICPWFSSRASCSSANSKMEPWLHGLSIANPNFYINCLLCFIFA
jgi:hypothetical protein